MVYKNVFFVGVIMHKIQIFYGTFFLMQRSLKHCLYICPYAGNESKLAKSPSLKINAFLLVQKLLTRNSIGQKLLRPYMADSAYVCNIVLCHSLDVSLLNYQEEFPYRKLVPYKRP